MERLELFYRMSKFPSLIHKYNAIPVDVVPNLLNTKLAAGVLLEGSVFRACTSEEVVGTQVTRGAVYIKQTCRGCG